MRLACGANTGAKVRDLRRGGRDGCPAGSPRQFGVDIGIILQYVCNTIGMKDRPRQNKPLPDPRRRLAPDLHGRCASSISPPPIRPGACRMRREAHRGIPQDLFQGDIR
jgi:hypothetical protein